jgi:hypothetical protein
VQRLPRAVADRIVLAADVPPWLRPDAVRLRLGADVAAVTTVKIRDHRKDPRLP